MAAKRTTTKTVPGSRLIQYLDKDSGQVLGTTEYEPGYGVHARRGDAGERATFLTHGYRAAIGAELIGYAGTGADVSRAKAAARAWVEAH